MSISKAEALVSTQWLADHLSAPDVRVVDATWYMPAANRSGREEYDACHIPGAVFFDLDEIADLDNPLPHMLPIAAKFASRVRKLGLGNGNKVVIYDANGISFAAARVWWMFRVFGHRDVVVLDGGLAKWKAEGRPIEDLPPMPRDRHFLPHVNTSLVRSYDQMLNSIKTGREQIIDARSPERFRGEVAEPWQVQKVGHMPGARNVPFASLIDPDSQTLKPKAELAEIFAKADLDLSKPITVSCGTGVTACVVAMALFTLGKDDVAVYDGSWAEWGSRDESPVEKG